MKVRTLAILTSIVFLACFFSACWAQEVRFYTSSTCGPCQLAKPKMAALAREGVVVKNINVDYGAPAHISRIPAYEFVDAGGRVIFSTTGTAPIKRLRELWGGSRGRDREQAPADNSVTSRVCRIKCDYVGGRGGNGTGNYFATGCYVTNGEESYIQSCGHEFKTEPGERITRITAHFPNNINVECDLVRVTGEPDLSILKPRQQLPFKPLPATGQMEHGEVVHWYGFGMGWQMRGGTGRADTSHLDHGYGNVHIETGPLVVLGDSGGPIINKRGEVVGVLYGHGQNAERKVVYLTCCRQYQTFFGIRRSTPRRTIQPSAGPAPTPAPPQPANLPPRDCGCREEFSKLNETIAIAIKRIELLEALPSECPTPEPGAKGEKGDRGPQGLPGKDGKDATIDENALAERITLAVLERIDLPTPEPTSVKHYVLVADSAGDYWKRLSDEYTTAKAAYSQIKLAPPPSFPVGTLPQMVEYQSGVPQRTIFGSRAVSEALALLARGETL